MSKLVLTISSNKLLQSCIKDALVQRQNGFCAHELDSSNKLIESFNTVKPSIIIVDFDLGVQAVTETICTLNSLNGHKIPLIVAFPKNKESEIDTIINAGIDDFIDFESISSLLIQRINICIHRNNEFAKHVEKSEQFSDISLAASQAGSSLLIIDKLGSIIWVNEGFEMLYECDLSDFKKKFGDNVFESHLNPRTAESMKRCAQNGEYVVYESLWFTKSNKRKNIQTSLTPIYDSNGIFSKMIAIETDITDLKMAEEALSEKHHNLLAAMEHLEDVNNLLDEQKKEIEKQKINLEEEKNKSDSLLLNILPEVAAHQLKKKGFVKPKKYSDVSVMFADFVNFSSLITRYADIEEFLSELGSYFEIFEEITAKRYIEKIKTIGDCYMCVGGLPQLNRSHPLDTVLAGLEIQKFIEEKAKIDEANQRPIWRLRIGIHTGSVMAGIIGKKKFAYDIWGDAVNIASRVESNGTAGKVRVSETTHEKVEAFFDFEKVIEINAKNMGHLNTFQVKRIKPEFSEDEDGYIPNAAFKKIIAQY
ncbi:MAG: adenylate/guanylate cyclase domain-containing protein [Bacteroidales bacterium]|jgi:PAS domain S-box-containing protein|nr:adenylate/guanylate cyclase domain-containing protein [Bacteroidales bacterium]MDY0198651.1 adenylate/guanylate cyclase domain-containing protein [Tenuifilaceae bacterium]